MVSMQRNWQKPGWQVLHGLFCVWASTEPARRHQHNCCFRFWLHVLPYPFCGLPFLGFACCILKRGYDKSYKCMRKAQNSHADIRAITGPRHHVFTSTSKLKGSAWVSKRAPCQGTWRPTSNVHCFLCNSNVLRTPCLRLRMATYIRWHVSC